MRQIACLLLVSSALASSTLGAQSPAGQPGSGGQVTGEAPQAQSAPPPGKDQSAQILDDLNRMESLNMNMSSEIEFLHDQNLQILLRTNAQMWTILIRDLRQQVEQQGRRKPTPPLPDAPAAKPDPR